MHFFKRTLVELFKGLQRANAFFKKKMLVEQMYFFKKKKDSSGAMQFFQNWFHQSNVH